MFIQNLLDSIYLFFLQQVSLEQIRTEVTEASTKQGWANKDISSLPIYPYFKLYIESKEEEALNGMTKYYFEMAIEQKALYLDKKNGGMKNGSTYAIITDMHNKAGIELDNNLSNLDIQITKQAIKKRVLYRLDMIDSIKRNGYSPSCKLIHADKKNGFYYISDGHHRVATMSLLNYKSIPIAVNNPWIIRRLRRIFRKIHPDC